MRVEKLTKTVVDKAKVEEGAERSIYWDKSMSGFGLVVSSGRKSFVCQYRAGRRSRRFTLGDAAKLSVEQARKQARIILGKVEMGGDPVEERRKKESAAANGFRSVCDRYLEAERRKDGKQQLRSLDHRHKMLERIWRTNAKLGARAIGEVKKSDLVQLLDDVEERARARGYDGRTMADRVLGTIRRIMNWHASRDDDFRSPIVRR